MKKKPTKPTPEDIQREIKWLEENKLCIRRYSAFHDDLHTKIDAELKTLRENLTEDQIYSKFSEDETAEEFNGDHPLVEAALDVRHWMDGESGYESPSQSWGPLIK